MEGWIKLHRRFLLWEWYKDSNTKNLFLHLLIKANHKPNNYQGITVQRGQLVTGRKQLSYEIGLSEQSIRTSLNRLKSTNEITIKTTNKNSIITILNYDFYQSEKETNQQANQQLTSNQPATNQQSTTNKNDNNEENENNNKKRTFYAVDANLDEHAYKKFLYDCIKEKQASRDVLFMQNKIDLTLRNQLWEAFIQNAMVESSRIEDEKHAWNTFKRFVKENSKEFQVSKKLHADFKGFD